MISSIANNTNSIYDVFKTNSKTENKSTKNELSEEEKKQVEELKKRDREVKQHEQAHVAAGGGIVVSGPTYQYQRGPDGKQYAVGGEVQIDNSPVPNDPEATIRKMQQVQSAALTPAEPSAQDRKVASQAAQTQAKARMELAQKRAEESKLNNPSNSNNIFSVYSNFNEFNFVNIQI